MRAAFHMAAQVAKGLGRGALLFRALQAKQESGLDCLGNFEDHIGKEK
jgi:hypothetical protein